MEVPPMVMVGSAVQCARTGECDIGLTEGIYQGTVVVAWRGLPMGESYGIVLFQVLENKGKNRLR